MRVAIVLDTDKLGELELAAKVSVPVGLGANADLALQGLDRRRNLRRNILVRGRHRQGGRVTVLNLLATSLGRGRTLAVRQTHHEHEDSHREHGAKLVLI